MATRRPMLRSALPALPALVAIAAVAVLVDLVYGPWYLNYDTRYALVWARDAWHGFLPEYGAAFAPTPHPLWTALASLALPFGTDVADDAMAWLVLLAFGTVVWLTYALGRALANGWVGLVAALVVLTRAAILRDVVLGYLDVLFAALVLGAVLLEVRRRRRGVPVLVVLAVAGLLRPEAWGLAALYAAHLWRGASGRERASYAALVAAAPALWFASDALVTGDALHSLHGTADLAEENDRRRSVSDVPYWSLQYFAFTVRLPVLVGIAAGLWFAWRRGLRGAGVPIATAAALIAAFAAGPLFGLPLIARYMRLPAMLLILFYGLAVAGFTLLAPSRVRTRWAVVGAAAAALSLVYLPPQVRLLEDLTARRDRDSAFYRPLEHLAETPAVRAAFARCPRVTASDHRPVPYLRWWLEGDPGSVTTAEGGATPPGPLFLEARRAGAARRLADAVAAPPGYRVVAQNRTWRLLGRPGC